MDHLGASLGHLGASWSSPAGPETKKTMIFLCVFSSFCSWGLLPLNFDYLALCCAMLGPLGAFLDTLGAILGPSWAILGLPWALLGPPWGHLGPILAHLGAKLGHPEASLAPTWATLRHLGGILTCSAPAWVHLVGIFAHYGPSWGRLWAIFGHLGSPRPAPEPQKP